jgi:hypothetical protein
MSTREREPEQSIPLKYAPERALASADPSPGSDRPRRESRPGGARPPGRRPPPVPRTREPAPPWKVARPKGSLEGDAAIEEFRERLALAPDLPPPPMRDDGGWVSGFVGRLAGCIAMAAIAAYGFIRISTPRRPAENGFAHAGHDPAADEQPDREPAPDRARVHAANPTNGSFGPAVLRSSPMSAAAVDADTLRPRNEPTPLNRPLLLATVPSPTPDPSPDLADGSRESTTSGIAVRLISSAPAAPLRRRLRPRARPLRQHRLRRGSTWGKLRLSSCGAVTISPIVTSPRRAWRFAPRRRAAMRRPRSHPVRSSIHWSSKTSAPMPSWQIFEVVALSRITRRTYWDQLDRHIAGPQRERKLQLEWILLCHDLVDSLHSSCIQFGRPSKRRSGPQRSRFNSPILRRPSVYRPASHRA